MFVGQVLHVCNACICIYTLYIYTHTHTHMAHTSMPDVGFMCIYDVFIVGFTSVLK